MVAHDSLNFLNLYFNFLLLSIYLFNFLFRFVPFFSHTISLFLFLQEKPVFKEIVLLALLLMLYSEL